MHMRMPCDVDISAAMKLRCQPSSSLLRFFTWMMAPPQSVMQYGMTTSWTMPGCSRLHSSYIAASRTVVSML